MPVRVYAKVVVDRQEKTPVAGREAGSSPRARLFRRSISPRAAERFGASVRSLLRIRSHGTASMSLPIATSPARSGFGPQLSLTYDSASGNGPLGFGWSLAIPSIARKTDKGLPKYLDEDDSDVFIFWVSGAEDLVPVHRQDIDASWVATHPGYHSDPVGNWVRDRSGHLVLHEDDLDGYRVRRYRPRIEGLFARIERWSRNGKGEDVPLALDLQGRHPHRLRARHELAYRRSAERRSRVSLSARSLLVLSLGLRGSHHAALSTRAQVPSLPG